MSDILLKRGKESNRINVTPKRGEPLVSFDDTTGKPRLFLGTGTDIGGIEIGASSSETISSLPSTISSFKGYKIKKFRIRISANDLNNEAMLGHFSVKPLGGNWTDDPTDFVITKGVNSSYNLNPTVTHMGFEYGEHIPWTVCNIPSSGTYDGTFVEFTLSFVDGLAKEIDRLIFAGTNTHTGKYHAMSLAIQIESEAGSNTNGSDGIWRDMVSSSSMQYNSTASLDTSYKWIVVDNESYTPEFIMDLGWKKIKKTRLRISGNSLSSENVNMQRFLFYDEDDNYANNTMLTWATGKYSSSNLIMANGGSMFYDNSASADVGRPRNHRAEVFLELVVTFNDVRKLTKVDIMLDDNTDQNYEMFCVDVQFEGDVGVNVDGSDGTWYRIILPRSIFGTEEIIGNYIQYIANNLEESKENISNKVTTFQTTPDDTHYPSEKLVKDQLDYKSSFESPLCLYPTEGLVVASRIPYVITEAGSAIRYSNLSANIQTLAVLQDVAWSTVIADYDTYNGIIKIVSDTTIEFTDDVFVSLEATLRADNFTGSSDKFLRFAWVWADNNEVISGTNTSYIFPPTESEVSNLLPIVKVSRKFYKGNKIKLRVTGAGSTGTSTARILKESTKCYIYEVNNTSGYERDKVSVFIRKKSDSSIVWNSGEIGRTTNLIKRSMNMAYSTIWDKDECTVTGNANSLGMSKITLAGLTDMSVKQKIIGYRSGDEYTAQIIIMNPTISKIKISLEDYLVTQGIYAEFGLTGSGSILSSGTQGTDAGTLVQAQITSPQTGIYILNIRGTPVADTSSWKDVDLQLNLRFEDAISGEIYIGFTSVKKGLYDITNNYHLLTDDANIPEQTYVKYLVGLDTILDASENYEVIIEDVTTKGLKTSQSDAVSFSTGT